MSSWIDEFLAQFVRVEELANARAMLVSNMTEMVRAGQNELWERIADIEKVYVSIPVSYTPNSKTVEIPRRDRRGEVYNVVALPFDHIERVFQEMITPVAAHHPAPQREQKPAA